MLSFELKNHSIQNSKLKTQNYLDSIHCLEFKLDFLPGLASDRQFRRPLASFTQNIVAFTGQVTT